jgi:hypothetical protein
MRKGSTWKQVSGKRSTHGREHTRFHLHRGCYFFQKKCIFSSTTFLVLRTTILASHLRYKKGIILVTDTVSENEF